RQCKYNVISSVHFTHSRYLFCSCYAIRQQFIILPPDFLYCLSHDPLYFYPGKPPVFIMYLVDDFFYLVGHVNPPFRVVFPRLTLTRAPGSVDLDDTSFRNMLSGNMFSVLASCSRLLCTASLVSW